MRAIKIVTDSASDLPSKLSRGDREISGYIIASVVHRQGTDRRTRGGSGAGLPRRPRGLGGYRAGCRIANRTCAFARTAGNPRRASVSGALHHEMEALLEAPKQL